jgi:hypothetical protein
MKWNMWGHTFKDIAQDSAQSTSWPFNILRSLAIWKPRRRNWGYDLLLSAALRAANEQLGMEYEDLLTFIELKMDGLFHFPKWLQGTSSYDEDVNVWRRYVQETVDNTFFFLRAANAFFLGLYLFFSVVLNFTVPGAATKPSLLRKVLVRLAITHGLIAAVALFYTRKISRSEWGKNIASGKTFMRPFPTENEFTSQRWETDPTIPQGPTTLPERMDILFGTRLDSPWLASYNRWLEYHPGNRIFQASIKKWAYLYPMYNAIDNDPVLLRSVVTNIIDEMAEETHGGRYLKQDHRSGDWVALDAADSFDLVRHSLATESNSIVKNVDRTLKFLIADYRFGRLRGSALAFESTTYLLTFQRILLRSHRPLFRSLGEDPRTRVRPGDISSEAHLKFGLSSRLSKPDPTISEVLDRPESRSESLQLPVGTLVMVYRSWDNTWAKGSVTAITGDNFTVDVTYEDDGQFEESVSIRRLRRPVHLQEGARARVYLEREHAFGVVSAVHANGHVDVVLDRGEHILDLYPEDYDIQYPTL